MQFILETEILTHNREEEDRQRDLGVNDVKIEAWFPFLIDLRSVIAIKPPGKHEDYGVPNKKETVIYTAWDSFVINMPFAETKRIWMEVKQNT